VLVTGLGASPGVASGKVRVLRTPAEGAQLLAGEVLVAPMTSPDWVPTMRRAAGVVTDSGGMTCHAAIVSRELRIPCIVGAREATRVLRDGEVVTIDGRRGQVLAGVVRRSAGRGGRARGCPRQRRTAGHPHLRQPRVAEKAEEVGRAAGRRRRAAARRVHDPRRPRRPAPA
jgi:pyruvate,water dikinase